MQTYISYKPLDSEIHSVAGRLLFSIGACDDAIKAYNYCPNIDKKSIFKSIFRRGASIESKVLLIAEVAKPLPEGPREVDRTRRYIF